MLLLASPCVSARLNSPQLTSIVRRSRINRHLISGSPTWSSLGFFLAPKRSAMRGVVSQLIRCRSTTKTVSHPGQPYVVKAGSLPLRLATCCLATRCRASLLTVLHFPPAPCILQFRHAFLRHRCRSTTKTVTHHQQPYVVKLVPNRAPPRFSPPSTVCHALLHPAEFRAASYCHRSRSTIKKIELQNHS